MTNGSREKPSKPYPDFPLFAHSVGMWAKKIRGKTRYFGKWNDWRGDLDRYIEQRDDLYAGKVPRRRTRNHATVGDLLNQFLADKQRLVYAGELAQRTWKEYFSPISQQCRKLLLSIRRYRPGAANASISKVGADR